MEADDMHIRRLFTVRRYPDCGDFFTQWKGQEGDIKKIVPYDSRQRQTAVALIMALRTVSRVSRPRYADTSSVNADLDSDLKPRSRRL